MGQKMDFLKKLFGGGNTTGDNRSYYVYVRPKRCEEIVEVRIDLMNELSIRDDGDGYWVRKMARATRCPFPSEVVLYFDKRKTLVSSEVVDGELVEKAVYDAWTTEQ